MEKILSTEDKIRRAEEIYNRRRENKPGSGTAKVSISDKKDIKLFKKVIVQILTCLSIYSVFYIVKNNNYIFSEDVINKTKEVLSYDIDFKKVYDQCMEKLNGKQNEEENKNTEEDINNSEKDENIGGAEETNEEVTEENKEITQMEQDASDIKEHINFINPIEGTITSTFGWRDPTTSSVPKFHTGLDIANVEGTKIKSSTDGEVILASAEGDYRKSS